MLSLNLPPSERSKWIYIVIFVAAGCSAVSKLRHNVSLPNAFLLVGIWATVVKLIFEHAWDLPMRLLNLFRFEPAARADRLRVLAITSAMAIIVTFLLPWR